MANFIDYLLSASLLQWAVLLYHRGFLARQRRFQLNRAFLLGGSGLAMLLPLLHISASSSAWKGAGVVRSLPEVLIGTARASPADEPFAGGGGWLAWGYLCVATLLGLLLVYRIGLVMVRIAASPREKRPGYTLVYGATDHGPASFFGYLFWDAGTGQETEGAQVMLAHERCHIRQWHSLDLMWIEILAVLCWFNPAIYLLRRDLRRCHEFLADHAAAQVGGKEALLRQVLARQLGPQNFSLANHFQSQIKARIMMLKTKSKHKALIRYLMILPLIGLMFACTSVEQDDADLIDAGPHDFVMLDKEPKPLNMNEVAQSIGYPQAAKDAGLSGKMVVRVKVGKDGKLIEHTVLREAHPILRKAVEARLYDLKFEPGVKDGKKVNAWVTIPFAFKLD